jgi:NAD(P)-dependent dehydrogenase (short-subunit alcohol dehydrogenase family)
MRTNHKENQNILITGGNRGLGLAMIEILLRKGHKVCTIIRKKSEGLQSLSKKYDDQINIFNGDVTDEKSIKKAIYEISRIMEQIDILINNSAVHLDPERLPIEQVDFSVYSRTFEVNSTGPLIVIKHALPLIRKGRKKMIVNISSEAGSVSNSWRKSEYAYCMSKSALNMASSILQNYLKEEGIKVLALHPGWFSSDMGGKEAPITPMDAALQVIDLLLKQFDLEDPVYYGPDGKVMDW